MQFQWTPELPTRSGFYYWQGGDLVGREVAVVQVTAFRNPGIFLEAEELILESFPVRHCPGKGPVKNWRGLWAGPLPGVALPPYLSKEISSTAAIFHRKPNQAEVASACMYYIHSYGLLSAPVRMAIRQDAERWHEAWSKVEEDTREYESHETHESHSPHETHRTHPDSPPNIQHPTSEQPTPNAAPPPPFPSGRSPSDVQCSPPSSPPTLPPQPSTFHPSPDSSPQ